MRRRPCLLILVLSAALAFVGGGCATGETIRVEPRGEFAGIDASKSMAAIKSIQRGKPINIHAFKDIPKPTKTVERVTADDAEVDRQASAALATERAGVVSQWEDLGSLIRELPAAQAKKISAFAARSLEGWLEQN